MSICKINFTFHLTRIYSKYIAVLAYIGTVMATFIITCIISYLLGNIYKIGLHLAFLICTCYYMWLQCTLKAHDISMLTNYIRNFMSHICYWYKVIDTTKNIFSIIKHKIQLISKLS